MAYTVSSRRSYGSRILNSFVGVLIGIGLIIGMSILLFWNEGRFNYALMAEQAQEVTVANSETLEDQLVWYDTTLSGGPMNFDGVIEDSNYIYLKSKVEVYAWIETSETRTHDNYGGSETTETTYYYNLGWTTTPENPANFEDPDERNKPVANKYINDVEYLNSSITTEGFNIITDNLTIDGERTLSLSEEIIAEGILSEDVVINSNYLYYKADGSTGPSTPSFNDIRVQYTYIPESIDGILLGMVQGDSIVKYTNSDGSLYRFFEANSLSEVISILDKEHKTTTWIIRLVGTALMCFGFALLTGPFSTLLMVVPFLGNASKFLLGIISFLIGIVYSFVVIVISAVFHEPIALAIAIGIIILLIIIGVSKKKKAKGKTKK